MPAFLKKTYILSCKRNLLEPRLFVKNMEEEYGDDYYVACIKLWD